MRKDNRNGSSAGVLVLTCGALALLNAGVAHAETPVPAATAAAQAPSAAESPLAAGYHKGFFIRSNPFEVTINGRVQARFTYEGVEGASDEAAFEIARARLGLKGHAFTDALTYKFQADFGKGFVALKDFYADYRLHDGWLHLRAGQWKRPFSRQQINSSGNLELVDRAITDKAFGAGRDIGVAVHNNYEKSPRFEYALGVFNGTGDKPEFSGTVTVDPATNAGPVSGGKFSNVPDKLHPAAVVRVGYNHGGIKGYSEADFEGGPLRFAVGASGLVDLDLDESDDAAIRGELDFMVKLHGFASTGGVYLATAQNGAGFADQKLAAIGFHGQLGYLLGKRYQLVARYGMVAPDGPDNNMQEIVGGVSIYLFKHGFKWQTDAGALISEVAGGGKQTGSQVRSQLQLAF